MIVSEVDNITDRPTPPTRQAIEEDRRKQLEAIQEFRRKLMDARGSRS